MNAKLNNLKDRFQNYCWAARLPETFANLLQYAELNGFSGTDAFLVGCYMHMRDAVLPEQGAAVRPAKVPTLVYRKTKKPVQVGDRVKTTRGDVLYVHSFEVPHKPDSEGKVCVSAFKKPRPGATMIYYVSVIGAEWINRNDR